MLSILWLRQDLRLRDQPALSAAAGEGAVIPLYILDDAAPGEWRMGGAQRWWLHHSLEALGRSLEALGSRLILRRGDSAAVLAQLAAETGAARVHAIRHYEPWWRETERRAAAVVDLCLHDGNRLAPPGRVVTGAGKPFKIYTPFWRALQAHLPPPEPRPVPAIRPPQRWPRGDALGSWNLLPRRPDWARGFDWTPGEAGALEQLETFADVAGDYAGRRNLPAGQGTSRLSPYLHFGEISPAAVWHRLERSADEAFRKELAWRDFAAGAMLHYPELGERPLRPAFVRFPWREGAEAERDLAAWTRGRTGYPIVDAGMRQLRATGWMHNRVRMIAASFLVKHLLIDWRRGARWFWDTLVDADYGNNGLNWQWIAGSGVDSAPFARIMAPLAQSERFDAGDYIRRWVPELAHLPDAAIHDPEASGARAAYPARIVGHREARARAMAALATIR